MNILRSLRYNVVPLVNIKRNIVFEPPYLDASKDEVPTYPLLNIQVKGYDYSVLERFAKWVHNTAVHMDIDVVDCWGTPCVKKNIKTYKKNSTTVLSSYDLETFERNVQIEDLSATNAPVFFEVIKAALPQGVELSIHEHMDEHFNIRKIPDLNLKELRTQLDEIGTKKK